MRHYDPWHVPRPLRWLVYVGTASAAAAWFMLALLVAVLVGGSIAFAIFG